MSVFLLLGVLEYMHVCLGMCMPMLSALALCARVCDHLPLVEAAVNDGVVHSGAHS